MCEIHLALDSRSELSVCRSFDLEQPLPTEVCSAVTVGAFKTGFKKTITLLFVTFFSMLFAPLSQLFDDCGRLQILGLINLLIVACLA